ncbi:hypothetical protein C7E13_13495, partial [Stenotrophomonas maltophilia]
MQGGAMPCAKGAAGTEGPVRGGRDEADSGVQARPRRRSRQAVDQASGGAWPRCWRRPGASAQGV